MKNNLVTFMVFLAGSTLNSIAQDQQNEMQGEIVTDEVLIEKENKKIVLPKIDKQYFRAKKEAFESDPVEVLIDIKEPELSWPPYKSTIGYEKVNKPKKIDEFNNYINAGFGNYSSPMIELGVFENFETVSTSNKLFYESFRKGPINGTNSGTSQFLADHTAIYKHDKYFIQPNLSIQNMQYRFYGNTDRFKTAFDSNALPRVNLFTLDFGINFKGSLGDVKYYIYPVFNQTNQNSKSDQGKLNQESTIEASTGFEFKFDEHLLMGLDLSGRSSKYKGGLEYSRSLILLNPWVHYKEDHLSLKGGFNLSTERAVNSNRTGFYPNLMVLWDFSEYFQLYGNLSGTINWNGLNDILAENEFQDDSLTIQNIENRFSLFGGIKSAIINNLMLDASFGVQILRNLPFYVPSESDSTRFTLAYDSGVIRKVVFKAVTSYTPSAISSFWASIVINNYSVNSLDRPWHLPTYEFQFTSSHQIKEKLLVSTNFIAMGGIKAPANVDFGIVNLRSILDVGVDFKYLISERASAWVEINNLGNLSYERYIGYPVRRITLKIGGMYRF